MMFRFNGVSERDMDLLFLEEFAVNKDFRDLFIQQIQDFDLNGYEIVSEELSFVDAALGESDLTIVLENKGHKVALLIEDKINAVAQQTSEALDGLWFTYNIVPIIGIVIALVIWCFYKLNDKDVQIMADCNVGKITKDEAEKLLSRKY